ncbi:MAG: NUDIX domain-containing protein [Patescibacteria group bacterium]
MREDTLEEIPIYHPLLKTKLEHVKVIHCILFHKNKILLLQRNQGMRYYPGYWSGVCGIVDEHVQMQDRVLVKVEEETGISKKDAKIITQTNQIEYAEKIYGKIWEINPFLLEVKPKKLHFDWNCQDHIWVSLEESLEYNVLPAFKEVLGALFPGKV